MYTNARRFIFILFLIYKAKTWNKFCSVMCENQFCNSENNNDCTQCQSPWEYDSINNNCHLSPT